MNKKTLLATLLLLIILLPSCHFVRSFTYFRPDHKDGNKFPKQDIAKSENEFVWTYAKTPIDLNNLTVHFRNGAESSLDSLLKYSKTNGFLIVQNKEIKAEKYYGNYNEASKNLAFSVSKSAIASIVGIAIDEGLLNYTAPITQYIPELLNNDSAFANITFQNVFEMNSGIKIRGKNAALFGDLARTYYGNNFYRFMKTIEIEKAPGGTPRYNQTDAELVALILKRVIGRPITEYFYEKIWNKIGATEAFWNTYKKDDLIRGYCCLNAKAKDFAKFAQLYLNDGVWNGEQILPKGWVSFVTEYKGKNPNNKAFTFYRHWFPSTDGKGDYTAQGFNGQFIYINPLKDLIIIRLGKRDFDKEINWESILRNIAQKL